MSATWARWLIPLDEFEWAKNDSKIWIPSKRPELIIIIIFIITVIVIIFIIIITITVIVLGSYHSLSSSSLFSQSSSSLFPGRY